MEVGSVFDIKVKDLFSKGDKNHCSNLPIENNNNFVSKLFFNTGRSAIEYLFKYQLNLRENEYALLPNYYCDSIISAIERANANYKFYKIKKDLSIDKKDLNSKISKCKVLFLIDYFGFRDEINVNILKKKNPNLIIVEDLTQSLLSNYELVGDYIIGSIRKWMPIPDGAFLFSKNQRLEKSIQSNNSNNYTLYFLLAQIMKGYYLKNNNVDKNVYLDYLKISMKSLFSDFTIRKISDISWDLYSNLDIDLIIKRRVSNYNYICKKLAKNKNIKFFNTKITSKNIPLGIPIYVNDRDIFNQYLIDNNVYCNIHWIIESEDKVIKYISNHILTIPCDQRYSIKELDYIIDVIEKYEWK